MNAEPRHTELTAILIACGALLSVGLTACRPPASTTPPPVPAENAAEQRHTTLDAEIDVAAAHDWVRRPLIDESETAAPDLRIVSAAPNITEICCALGLRENLVGRTRYCVYPPAVRTVADIGALIDVNIERLLALEPDVILVSGKSRSQAERFRKLNLRFEALPDETLDDLFVAIRRTGEICGRPRTADALCRRIDADLQGVTSTLGGGPPRRVLLLIGTLADPPRPPYVAGPGSFYDQLLRRAGHENVAPAATGAFGPLSLEYIVQTDPDVIVELDADGSARPNGDADARRVWSKVGALSAVRDQRVRVLAGGEHFLLGPRIALTYAEICAACLDPGE